MKRMVLLPIGVVRLLARRLWTFPIFLVVAGLTTSCLYETKQPGDRPSVCGYVYDGKTGKPIESALVGIKFCLDYQGSPQYKEYLTVETDGTGYFELGARTCVGNFRYEIKIEKADYETYLRSDYQLISGALKDCYEGEYFLSPVGG